MKALDLEDPSLYQRTSLIRKRTGSGLPRGLRLVKRLAKGANNSVFLYETQDREKVIVRQPRSKSDTKVLGNATWEFRNTAIAVKAGAAPALYDAWYNRHRTEKQPAGLHFVCEHFDMDVHKLLYDHSSFAISNVSDLRRQTCLHLRNMAKEGLFNYDLKPSNMVCRMEPSLEVRFIDFGRDFSEWRPYDLNNDYLERAPILSKLQTAVDCDGSYDPRKMYEDLCYALMVIVLSANISFNLGNTSQLESTSQRDMLNFLVPVASDLRRQIQGRHVTILKSILREERVRDTLRHYIGKKNCGTKRTFDYSGFSKR